MSDKLKILFLSGLPGSGKSTYAYAYVKQNPNTVRINKDDIRDILSKKNTHLTSIFSSINLEKMFGCDWDFANDCENHLVKFFDHDKKRVLETIKNDKFKQIEALVLEVEDAIIKFAVEKKKNIVGDNTHYSEKHVGRYKKFCQGYAFETYDMHKQGGVSLA